VQKSSHKTVLGTVWEDCNSQKKFALLIFLGGSSIECGGRPLQRRLTRRQNDSRYGADADGAEYGGRGVPPEMTPRRFPPL
jgi:hypothetical protein